MCKEKAILTINLEDDAQNLGFKPKATPVFFISLVGANKKGDVEEDEYLFDIYTKEYDFLGTNVQVKSAQYIRDYMKNQEEQASSVFTKSMRKFRCIGMKEQGDIYSLIERFIKLNPDAHYVLDEVPFLGNDSKTKTCI